MLLCRDEKTDDANAKDEEDLQAIVMGALRGEATSAEAKDVDDCSLGSDMADYEVAGDTVASVGVNRKLIVFDLEEVPEMGRGKGVILQRFKDGGLADVTVFEKAKGLSWQAGGGRVRTEPDLSTWLARRGGSGKLPPNGFPRPAKFT